ncbi:hypothetical protein D3C73_1049440 [compost metagenome]
MGPCMIQLAGGDSVFELGPPPAAEVAGQRHGGVVSDQFVDPGAAGGLQRHKTAITVRHDVRGAALLHDRLKVRDLRVHGIARWLRGGVPPTAAVVAVNRAPQHAAQGPRERPVQGIGHQGAVNKHDAGWFSRCFRPRN